jgi:hypothetical protein
LQSYNNAVAGLQDVFGDLPLKEGDNPPKTDEDQ